MVVLPGLMEIKEKGRQRAMIRIGHHKHLFMVIENKNNDPNKDRGVRKSKKCGCRVWIIACMMLISCGQDLELTVFLGCINKCLCEAGLIPGHKH
jgi:hypothetical protein